MTGRDNQANIAALRRLEQSLNLHLQEQADRTIETEAVSDPGARRSLRMRSLAALRKLAWIGLPALALVSIGFGALWLRLNSGPISLDLATPWITAAIEEKFDGQHRVEVGGTQIERDEDGNTAIRIRDIVVRDRDGAVVAHAPKAEVGVSMASLLSARIRAESLNLVGAEMSIRIEPDGGVTVFAGTNTRPIASASMAKVAAPRADRPAPLAADQEQTAAQRGIGALGALLAWIDGLGATGLDGHDLSELGLKSGNLVVDDRRTGKRWRFEKIDLSLTRFAKGGVGLAVSSDDAANPWSLKAAVTPASGGRRLVAIDAQKVSLKHALLASRLGDGEVDVDIPMSLQLRAEIGADGMPLSVEGRLLADGGSIVRTTDRQTLLALNRAEATFEWDSVRRVLSVPFHGVSGANRLTLLAEVQPPVASDGAWGVRLSGGTVVLSERGARDPLILNRIQVRLDIDPAKHRIDIVQGDVGNMDLRVALSGGIDFSDPDPRLAVGIAATRMSLVNLKRLWPSFVSPAVRNFVEDRFIAGIVERIVIATNTPMSLLFPDTPPLPDDGLNIEMAGSGLSLRPIDGLPVLNDVGLKVRVTGRTANVDVDGATVDLPSGKKLGMANANFHIADTAPKAVAAIVRFRLDGTVPAAAELLTMGPLRGQGGLAIDPATSRGSMAGQISLGLNLVKHQPVDLTTYAVTIDAASFAADKMLLGQKLEAAALRITANPLALSVKGEVKINGTPGALDYKKTRGGDTEIRIQASLDEAARTRFGFNVGTAIAGPVGVKLSGRIPPKEQDSKFYVEADLGAARIDNLLPGWQKAAGRSAKATFSFHKGQTTRLDDLTIDGSGALVRGSIELDSSGDVVAANFPVFSLADSDKSSLKADRGPDGTLRVVMRGDVYDGRGFLKALLAGGAPDKSRGQIKDLDLDIRIGAIAGFNGESLRALDLKMSRRAGAVRAFSLSGKLGRDASLKGDLRGRQGGRQVLFLETADAGALFRFADIYARVQGGEMWVAMDPPTLDNAPLDGLLNVRDFVVRGEPTLNRVASGAGDQRAGVEFSRLTVEFTKRPGKFVVRDGVVRGPIIGATIDGVLDYQANDVRMRGTFVPLYGLNNMFGQIPLFGFFLGGGSNEGLVGITYEVVGTPSAPVLRVNPISAVAPGLLRKFFEFPSASGPARIPADPAR